MPNKLSKFSKEEANYLRKLGERIRHIRKEKGITQVIFGEKAKVNHNLIGRIERGERVANIIQLLKICEVLEIDLLELLDFSE